MRLFGFDVARRASLENPNTPISKPAEWLLNLFGTDSDAGETVTPETAMKYSAVWAAVRVLSESVAQLPLHIYKKKNRRRIEANPRLQSILADSPNKEMSSYTWRETSQAHVLTYGNSYSFIDRDSRGMVRGLYILLPDKVTVKRTNGELIYIAKTDNGEDVLRAKDVLHIKGLGFDGLTGYSPITMHAQTIGLGMAATRYGARFFKHGGAVSGVLESPLELTQEAADRLKTQFADTYAGADNAHKTLVLEQGMKYNKIGLTPEDAQLISTRKFEITDIARIFRIPQHMLNDTTGMTFGNMEQRSIEFVQHSLVPWLKRWEQEIQMKLLHSPEFLSFSVEGLLRGDTTSRYEAYRTGIQNGWLSPNEVRVLENRDPVKGGDIYLVPLNMQPTSMIMTRAIMRVSNREKTEFIRAAKKYNPDNGGISDFIEYIDRFLLKHRVYVQDHLALNDSAADTYIEMIKGKIMEMESSLELQTWDTTNIIQSIIGQSNEN